MSRRAWRALSLLVVVTGCSNTVALFEHDAGERDAELTDVDAESARDGAIPDGGTGDAEPGDKTDAELLPPDHVRAAAAFGHTCVLDGESLFCWGRNHEDQLGLATAPAPGLGPVRVSERAYSQVCAGEEHTCALRSDGHVECWGSNKYGQLGLGDTQARALPTALPDAFKARTLACGGFSTCAIDDVGVLSCWGRNDEGEAGQADPYGSPDVLVPTPIARSGPFRSVALGQGHACALRESGELLCWGRNNLGQLGIGNEQIQVRPPTAVTAGIKYRAVTAAMSHSCAIRQDGRLFCWGNNLDGLLGAGSSSAKHYLPVQVGDATDHLEVQNSWFHTCIIREGGRLFCWGRNVEGQLGLGDTEPRSRPVELAQTGWSTLAIGHFHSCAVRDGSLYCWGKNEDGELGLGLVGRKNVPTRVRLQ